MIKNLSTKKMDSYVGIPYVATQCTNTAVDCLGFIGLIDPRVFSPEFYGYSLDQGISYLKSLGYKQDTTRGNLAILVLGRNRYHLCIIVASYIYHASIVKGYVVRDDYNAFKHLIKHRFYI